MAIATGGYALLLATRRGPVPTAEPSEPAPRPALPQAPDHLPRIRPVVPASADLGDRLVRERHTIAITVERIPADFPGTAGVGVFDIVTGALIEWLPILESARNEGRAALSAGIPGDTAWVCLATDLELARHGYLHRLRCTANEQGGKAAFDASLHATTLLVRFGDHAPPVGTMLRAEREDDPHWHMSIELGAAESTDSAGKLHWNLPAGSYRLRPIPPADWLPVPLQVPASAEVPVGFARA